METVNIKMYKAQDSIDGQMSMFAVLNDGKCAVSYFNGDCEPWFDCDLFMSGFVTLAWSKESRIEDMIDPELIWERNVKV